MAVPTIEAAITVLTESRAIDFSLPDVVVSAAVMRNALLTHSLVWAASSDRSPTLWRVSSLLLVFAACTLWAGNKKAPHCAGLQDSRLPPCLRWRGSSLYAESVRQRRRDNNSCGQQCERIESSHRGEPPFGFEVFFSDFHPNCDMTIGAVSRSIYQVFTM